MGKKLEILGASTFALGLCLTAASPASAINQVGCSSIDFAKITAYSTTCWANAGAYGITLPGVSRVWGGNNSGQVTYSNNTYTTFLHYNGYTINPTKTGVQIIIF